MKISADMNHKYYHPDAVYGKVFLDDVEQNACLTADSEEGWIERFRRVDGRLITVDGSFVREIVYGKVRVEIHKPAGYTQRE